MKERGRSREGGSGNSSIQAIYSYMAPSYAHDHLCLVGDAGAVFPPFAGSGVLRAVGNAISLTDALADAPAVDDALRQWSEAQLQAAAQVIPNTEGIERGYVFGMPDLTTMSTTATNDWMSATYPGLVLTLQRVTGNGPCGLRHPCASLMLNAGVSATEAAQRLGHSVAMLLKRYANCIDGQEQAASDRIARALEDSGV